VPYPIILCPLLHTMVKDLSVASVSAARRGPAASQRLVVFLIETEGTLRRIGETAFGVEQGVTSILCLGSRTTQGAVTAVDQPWSVPSGALACPPITASGSWDGRHSLAWKKKTLLM
jgi:hypothetical protein